MNVAPADANHHPIFGKFKRWEGQLEAGFSVNFLGAKTPSEYFTLSRVEPPSDFIRPVLPIFNEEYFEWIDLLEAVDAARDEFVMIELGAGYGRWLANAVAALRASRGLPYALTGVEPEPTHFLWMREHLENNGADLSRCKLHEAAVAGQEGSLWFYVGRPSSWYGQAIAPAPRLRDHLRGVLADGVLVNGERVKKIDAISLNLILEPLHKVDLVDLDVQGAELDVLESAAPQLRKIVRIHIGTHGAAIEAGLRSLFQRLGWRKINDFACGQKCDTSYGEIEFQDGVQTWINPAFAR